MTTQHASTRRGRGPSPQPDPPSLRTLAARRREAEATLEALAAQERAVHDSAAAADAQYRAQQEAAQARHAELAAELDKLGRYVEQQREREYAQFCREHDRREEMMRHACMCIH